MPRIDATERSQTADQTGRLGSHRTGEGVGFVEDQVVEARSREEFDVSLPSEEQLKLLDVSEKNSGLSSGRPHGLARADLFRRVNRLASAVPSGLLNPSQVVRTRRTWAEAGTDHVDLPLRSLPDIDAEGHSRACQQPAKPHELVLSQGIHRVDDDGADSRFRGLVLECQALADNGIEEALGLPRTGAGGDQRRAALPSCPDRTFLVAVEMADARRDPGCKVGVKDAFLDQLLDGSTGPEGAGEAYVWTSEERGGSSVVKGEEVPHLLEEVGIGERIGSELIPEEALRDLLDVNDGVQGHVSSQTVAGGVEQLLVDFISQSLILFK